MYSLIVSETMHNQSIIKIDHVMYKKLVGRFRHPSVKGLRNGYKLNRKRVGSSGAVKKAGIKDTE